MIKYFLAIPTYNGKQLWQETVNAILEHSPDGTKVDIIDSGSTDETTNIAKSAGFNVYSISSSDFNHGGTRNLAVNNNINEYDIVIFLTQDAIPQKGFIECIIAAFNDPLVACAYGRQLPHKNANPIAQHARFFNYPAESHIYDKSDSENMGIKTVFMSNSFSAYRLSVFKQLGGFPSNTILCEDMFYTAKAILAGYKSAYLADALVCHSHNYTYFDEFKRYFDIGVFHVDTPWIQDTFGGAGGEGIKFIKSEFDFLLKNNFIWIPTACLNNLMKFIGYKCGKSYKRLNKKLVRAFSMHKRYWD